MRRPRFLAACLAAALVPTVAARAAGPAPVFPYPMRATTLDNGLAVVSVAFDAPGIVTYGTLVRVGSRNEVEPDQAGAAHALAHLSFQGTASRTPTRYQAALRGLGAASDAALDEDSTYYSVTIPISGLAAIIELEADRLRNIPCDEAAVLAVVETLRREFERSRGAPTTDLDEALRRAAYTTHTYRRPVLGTATAVGAAAMPGRVAVLQSFRDRWYRPENCVVVAAGAVDHEALVTLVRKAYGGWSRGGLAQAQAQAIPIEPPQNGPREAVLAWPRPAAAALAIGYHIPAGDPADPDAAALRVLGEAIFGVTSPLYMALVLDERKVVAFTAGAWSTRDPGLFTVVAQLRGSVDLADVRARIESALVQAGSEPITPWRLGAIKDHLRHEFLGSLDGPEALARAVARSIARTGRPDSWNDLFAAIETLTPDDLQRVAARHFATANRTVVTLAPEVAR